MQVRSWFFSTFVLVNFLVLILREATPTQAQQPSIELPVELIGFPVIILAVRISNFVKKLAYSLNPNTYVSRTRRSISGDDLIDMGEAEKRLVAELGENVCIYTRVCLHHAERARKSSGATKSTVDWNDVFSHYKASSEKNKEFYLLSVFLGDFLASPRFCNLLAKRGRVCTD